MKKYLITLIAVGLLLIVGGTGIMAQSSENPDSLGLTVFPALQDVEVTPGQNTRLQVQFKNGTGEFLSGAVRFADFVVKDEMGTPLLIENQQMKPKYAASSWLTTTTPAITIPPSDFATVDIYVDVPQEITACGHYAIAYFEPETNARPSLQAKTGSAAAVTPRIGALLNFKVQKPDCVDNIQVTKFNAPLFLEYGPVTVDFDLLNLGDVHVAPRAVVMLSNMFGKTVSQEAIQELRIFPEAVKNYTPTLGSKWMVGRYRVSLSGYSNGPKNVPFVASAYVWVFPWRIALIILLTLLIAILLGKNIYGRVVSHETMLEKELEDEREQIEKLKRELRERKE